MHSRPKTNKKTKNNKEDWDNEEFNESEASPNRITKSEDRRPVFRILTSCSDLIENQYDKINNTQDNNIKKYEKEHPEANLAKLFTNIKYPPKNNKEKEDHHSNSNIIFKKVMKKNKKSQSTIEKEIDKEMERRKKRKKEKLKNKIMKDICQSENDGKRKTLIFKECMAFFSEKFNNKPVKNIEPNSIEELGQIFYIINYANNMASQEEKKELCQIKYINFLVNNNNISKKKFGPFSWVKGDSQIIGQTLSKMKLDDQKLLALNNSNIFFDEFTIFLILKAKFIKKEKLLSIRQYFFNFFIEEKLIPSTVKVKFYEGCSREKMDGFIEVMEKIQSGDEFLMAFAFNSTFKFDNLYIKKQDNDLYEYVFYIDSSIANPNIEKIYKEINN